MLNIQINTWQFQQHQIFLLCKPYQGVYYEDARVLDTLESLESGE